MGDAVKASDLSACEPAAHARTKKNRNIHSGFFVWHSCMHMYDGTYMTTAIIYNCNIPIVMTAGQFICGCVSADLSVRKAMLRY
ncbi:hypothetical protein EV681_3500 [Advenella incenata]|jgi:hypothetical protein|uniref:Uncharacterized protein n=1 Tax=Advenella incenata TaxID=267800 RepID=A0A4Q7VD01_9BURK|nr:hypothetical protein EV681_3500 [Advenella incenata]